VLNIGKRIGKLRKTGIVGPVTGSVNFGKIDQNGTTGTKREVDSIS